MKKIIKTTIVLCLSISLIASTGVFSFAEGQVIDPIMLANIDITTLSDNQIELIKDEIATMNNSEFDQYAVNLVQSASNKEILLNNLAEVDVYIDYKDIAPSIQRGVSVGNSTMTVYSMKRSSESFYRLFAITQLNTKETRPGSEDVVAIYFNSNLATYYGTSTVGDYTNLKDSSKRNSGTVVFNFDDKLAGTNAGSSIVYVIPKTGTSGKTFEYAAKWVHTYTKTDISGTFNAGISYGGNSGITGSIGVEVTVSSSESTWQRTEDNATYF